MHRIWLEDMASPGQILEISGDEAAHASGAKRLRVGEHVELLNGAGWVGTGVVDAPPHLVHKSRRHEPTVRVRVESTRLVPQRGPRIEICTAVPKGGRLDDMIDQLTQIGAHAWVPLMTERGVAETNDHKALRLQRVVRESCKQSGRPWAMELCEPIELSDAMRKSAHLTPLFADAGGVAMRECFPLRVQEHCTLRILIGPEGGWSERERQEAAACGISVVAMAPHVMRIETAAVAAAAQAIAFTHSMSHV